MPKKSLTVFEEVPYEYEEWLDGFVPHHPWFDKDAMIQAIVMRVKDLLLEKIVDGCAMLLKTFAPQNTQLSQTLTESLQQNQVLWRAVISGYKYGVIYLCSRVDARNLYFDLIQKNLGEAQAIKKFLSQNSLAIRAINYGIRKYIEDDTIETTLATRFVPLYGIAVLGPKTLAVRESDFNIISPQKALETSHPIYDLHDFSHIAAATLNQTLYGNKYQSSLSLLSKGHVRLITSPGLHDLTGSRISDGILYSEFLTGIFTQQISLEKDWTYDHLTKVMATLLTEYLICERELLHPSTERLVKNTSLPTPHQLAILVQNKSYELPASEMEQKIFTRGGPIGDSRDELDALDPLQRIESLASKNNKRWMYFEVRNTLKHRAQVEAYCLVARELARLKEPEICGMILDALNYEDVKVQKRVNLWKIVAVREWDKMSSREKWEIVGGKKRGDGKPSGTK